MNGKLADNNPHVQKRQTDNPENEWSKYIQALDSHFSKIGIILHDLQVAQQKKVLTEWKRVSPNKEIRLNFNVQSIYVDNSKNANAITIQRDGSYGSFIVAANAQQWVHPLGGNIFTVSGTFASDVFMDFVDTLIPVK